MNSETKVEEGQSETLPRNKNRDPRQKRKRARVVSGWNRNGLISRLYVSYLNSEELKDCFIMAAVPHRHISMPQLINIERYIYFI